MKRLVWLALAGLVWACNAPATKEEASESLSVNSEIPLVVGTYTRKEGHVDGKGKGIYLYAFDTASGALTYKSVADGIINPSYVAADGQTVVAVSEVPNGEVVRYQFDSSTQTLNETHRAASNGDYPCHVSIHPSGEQVYVANYGTGSVSAYSSQLQETWKTQHEGKGTTSRQEAAHAHMVWTNPNRQNELFAVDLGIDRIKVYKHHNTSFEWVYDIAAPAGSGPRQLAFHPTEPAHAYVINELSGKLAHLMLDSMGQYTYRELYSVLEMPDTTDDAGSADIQITLDGRYVYTSTRKNENNIAIFKIEQHTGALTLLGHQPTEGKTPRCIKLDPTGKFLLAANQDSDTIITFKINADGTLEKVSETNTPTPVSLAFLD